jgi:hypothetical protein
MRAASSSSYGWPRYFAGVQQVAARLDEDRLRAYPATSLLTIRVAHSKDQEMEQ